MITDIGNTNGRRPLDLHDLQESKSEIANCGWRARPLLHNWRTRPRCNAMIGENWQLVTNEPVEFEKTPGVVQDSRKITDHFRGIYRVYPNLVKENRWMPTCNHQLDLQTRGSQPPIMPKNLPNHWCNASAATVVG